jgi:hypothetical protein
MRSVIAAIVLAVVAVGFVPLMRREARRAEFRRTQRHWAQVRVAVARANLERLENFAGPPVMPAKEYYRYSIRLMESERDLDGSRAARLAALVRHRDRMRRVRRMVLDGPSYYLTQFDQRPEVELYVAEAELWVMRAKAGG